MAARSNLQRVRLWEEPNGSFGIDGTGTLGNFLDLRSMESAFTPDRVSLPDQRARAYRVDQAKDQHGFKNTTYDWSGHLISHGITLNAAASASPTSVSNRSSSESATLCARSRRPKCNSTDAA